MEDKEAIIEEVIAICEANKKNMYCDKYQLIRTKLIFIDHVPR